MNSDLLPEVSQKKLEGLLELDVSKNMCSCYIAAGSEPSKTCFRFKGVLVLLMSPIAPKTACRREHIFKIVLKFVLGVPCDLLFSWRWKISRQKS